MKRALVTAVAGLALLAVAAGGASAAPAKHAKAKSNIVQIAVGHGQFTTLVSLVKKAGLVGALSGKGPLHGLRSRPMPPSPRCRRRR